MNTWLSGMSPVAAEFASAWSADGAELVVVGADGGGEVFVGALVVVGALLLLEPQPAASTAAAKRTATRAAIAAHGLGGRLNGA
jgi:hypothetical protein